MPLKITTPPAVEPITAAEAKLHLRVDVSDDDALIGALITAVREHAETITQRALAQATYCLYLDEFPAAIEVPRPPLGGITHIKYVDPSGTLTTLASTEYTVSAADEPALIVPAYGKTWPTTQSHVDVVQVTFTAGYTAELLPDAARAYMLAAIGTLYANRESAAQADRVPKNIEFLDRLLDGLRVWSA